MDTNALKESAHLAASVSTIAQNLGISIGKGISGLF